EATPRAPGLRGHRRQGRPASADPARVLASPRARRVSRRAGVLDLPALRDPREGRLRARVGPAPHRRQPHPGERRLHVPAGLDAAGRILGAGRLRVLGEITAPLARSGIIATWCFVFIGVIRELSASIILFTPNTKVISVVIFDLKEEGEFGAIAVLGLFMLLMTFAAVLVVQTLLGRDFVGGKE